MAGHPSWYDAYCKRLESFTSHLPGVHRGRVEAVHQARVASRRLRELVPLAGWDSGTAQALGRRLRKVTQDLGPVRELDVLALLLEELHESGRYPATALWR